MSIDATAWVWKHSRSSGDELVMLLVLADCAFPGGYGRTPDLDELAERCRLPNKTAAYRVFGSLMDAGEISPPPECPGDFNHFVIPGVAELAEPPRRTAGEPCRDQQLPLGQLVYVLGSPGSSLVKIGRSDDVGRRVKAIQNMSPLPLTVLWSTPGGAELEARLHRVFADHRKHGEWFDFGTTDPVTAIRGLVARQMERPGD